MRRVFHHPAWLQRVGLREDGQACPRCATDEDGADASENLAPSRRMYADLRHDQNEVIPSDGGWDSENASKCCSQDQMPRSSENGLTNRERRRAGSDANKRRTEDAGTTMKCHHASADCDRKRQRVYRQREDQPAEQADTKGVQEKSKGERGGGSMCNAGTVAPSTTTAQLWISYRNGAELRRTQLHLGGLWK